MMHTCILQLGLTIFVFQIGEIHFKNYYTALVSIQAKVKEQSSTGTNTKLIKNTPLCEVTVYTCYLLTCHVCTGTGESKWKTCVKNFQLMPNSHSDQGSENYFTIMNKQVDRGHYLIVTTYWHNYIAHQLLYFHHR